MAGGHSPRHSLDNPKSRRPTRPTVTSPWNQVVRGESEPVPAAQSSAAEVTADAEPPIATVAPSVAAEDSGSAVESSDNGGGNNGGNNGGAVKSSAWKKPSSNGEGSEASSVIDTDSWPALSESTKATMKSELSSKGLLDGSSVPQLQVPGSKPSSSSHRQVSDKANVNNMLPARHKSFKHNNSNVSSNGGHPQQSAPQLSIAATGSHNYSPKDHAQRSGSVPNDHPQPRNSFRNRNSGSHQRGDGANHDNYGNRRDHDWNAHRSFNGRDTHIPPRGAPRYMRPPPPPSAAQFIHTPPVRPFSGPFAFHELAPPTSVVYVGPPAPPPHPDSLRGVPFVPPMPHHGLYIAIPDPQLQHKMVTQINYYFSNENLIKDTFLRKNMDDHGWVPLSLIAGFKKIKQLTDNIQLIIDCLRASSVVEVQGDKIRRRHDWRHWILPSTLQFPDFTGSQSNGMLNHDLLAEQVQNIGLDTPKYDDTRGPYVPDASQPKPSSRNLNSTLQPSRSGDIDQPGNQGSDHSNPPRN